MTCFYEEFFNYTAYNYQRLAWCIFTEAFLYSGKFSTYAIEFPRQSGKTDSVAYWIAYFSVFSSYFEVTNYKPLNLILFAPTKSQASIDFIRYRKLLPHFFKIVDFELSIVAENSQIVELSNSSTVEILHLTPNANVVGNTGNFLLFEESQDLEDDPVDNKALPMGASTNAPSLFVGTAGVRNCKFYNLIETGKAYVIDANDVIEDKEKVYKKTGLELHRNYLLSLKQRQQEMLPVNFRRQFLNEWNLAETEYMNKEEFKLLTIYSSRIKTNPLYLYGIDQALKGDMCIVSETILDPLTGFIENIQNDIIPIPEKIGQKTPSLYKYLLNYFRNRTIDFLCVDTTANQTFIYEWLINNVVNEDKAYPYDFSGNNKNVLFDFLKMEMGNGSFKFLKPASSSFWFDQTEEQFTHLETTYTKTGKKHISAMNNFHDDIPCAVALSVFGKNLTSNLKKDTYF